MMSDERDDAKTEAGARDGEEGKTARDELFEAIDHFKHAASLFFDKASKSPAIGKINYYMLGDQNHQLSNQFGVLREGVGLADRGTFVLDPEGVIQLVEITPEGVGRNAAELLRKVKALQYWAAHPGEVCPAKWEEGADTLAPSLDLVGKL